MPLGATGPFLSLPPLKEGTEYAVLVTDGVLDTTAKPLQRSTLSRILLFDNPLVDANGKSQLSGQPDAVAAGLEKIRQGVGAAATALAVEKPALTKDHIVLGYTFRTQTITQTSLQLAAAPAQSPATFVPVASTDITTAFVASVGGSLPAVGKVFSVTIPTLNPINVATGALNPDSTKWTPSTVTALVLTPATPTAGAPLVVFQHGLGRSKTDVAAIASKLAATGFVTVAIDAPLHGDRSLCVASSECLCIGGGTGCNATCNVFPAAPSGTGNVQGDAVSGVCSAGSVPTGPSATPQPISGRFFVSANLFRTRDALRQDVLDTSALVFAMTSAAPNPLATQLADPTVAVSIDPTKVYWIGQSLGGILGTLNTAANPRISKAVLNVPGGTLTDVFTQSPTFGPQTAALLLALPAPIGPIDVANPADAPKFLQFVQVAKLVLDGGDPVNFARHLVGDATHPTLPNLLVTGTPSQTAKAVLGQVAIGDTVIPNPFNFELLGNVFTSPLPASTPTSNVATYTSGGGAATHGFLLDFVNPTLTAAGQADVANFLVSGTLPPASQNF